MWLKSSAFEDQRQIPIKYTCEGENINPPFEWGDVPEGTESFVFIMDDPDAPSGTWDHWINFDIPKGARKIVEGKEPEGGSGSGTGGNLDYYGPCPPDGEHKYFFKLYALSKTIDLPDGVSKQEIERSFSDGSILDKAVVMGRYKKVNK